jgi:hypothetical protein
VESWNAGSQFGSALQAFAAARTTARSCPRDNLGEGSRIDERGNVRTISASIMPAMLIRPLPVLSLIAARTRTPLSVSAWIYSIGTSAPPNPPIMIVAPSVIEKTALLGFFAAMSTSASTPSQVLFASSGEGRTAQPSLYFGSSRSIFPQSASIRLFRYDAACCLQRYDWEARAILQE